MGFFLHADQTEMDILSGLIAQDVRSRRDEIEWLILEEGRRRGISYEREVYQIRVGRVYLELGMPVLKILRRMGNEDLRENGDEIRWLLRAEMQRRALAAQKSASVPESKLKEAA
jgi:hypothetical protein